MASTHDEAMRWLARSLAWDHTIAELRRPRPVRIAAALPAPPAEPIGLREPERVPFGAPRERVPRRDHRVA
jgi:hypothetical protein